MSLFNLPQEAPPMPPVRNFGYQKVNSLSDIRDVVGQTHKFRLEPSGTQWWVPDRSYFRVKLQINVTMNKARIAGLGLGTDGTGPDTTIDSFFPMVVSTKPLDGAAQETENNYLEVGDFKTVYNPTAAEQMVEYDIVGKEGKEMVVAGQVNSDITENPLQRARLPLGWETETKNTASVRSRAPPRTGQIGAAQLSTGTDPQNSSVEALTSQLSLATGNVLNDLAAFLTAQGKRGYSHRIPLPTGAANGVSTDINSVKSDVWSHAMKYRFLESLKFVDLADNCVDSFFDQISFSVGTTKTETIQDPQLTQTMRQRVKCGAFANGIRQDLVGVFKDEQRPNIFSGNLGDKSDNSVFSLLGYDNININIASGATKLGMDIGSRTFSIDFEVLYRPPLAVFRKNHAMPACRYEVEFKGVSNQIQLQNNFFHCTRPGGLGRWQSTFSSTTAGNLEKGPACKFDGTLATAYQTGGSLAGHASHQLFFFEPISAASGVHHHRDVIDAHLFGRQAYLNSENLANRIDPGVYVSAKLMDMHLEMAVVEGMEAQAANFVLSFDHIQPIFQSLTDSQDQNITYDVDARANTFFFGFRKTTVDDDCCLQAGHLTTPANTERDLIQYHINFDLKTRPQNFATEIDLKTYRGANNEQLRSQVNTMVHFKGYPETVRSWLKKGPYYAYHWPRGINSNATRFNLQIRTAPNNTPVKSYGPFGQFEYERPITTANFDLDRVNPVPANGRIDLAIASNNDYIGQFTQKLYPETAPGVFDFVNPVIEKSGFYLKPTVYLGPGNQPVTEIVQQASGYVPYWSPEVPQNLALQKVQTRLLSCDYPSPNNYADITTTSLTPGNYGADRYTFVEGDLPFPSHFRDRNLQILKDQHIESNLHLAFRRNHTSQIDMGYRGTVHSQPDNMRLNSTKNSCILFQVVPKSYYISIVHGRVTAVETPMNNN